MQYLPNKHICPNCGLNLNKLICIQIKILSTSIKKDTAYFSIYTSEKDLRVIKNFFIDMNQKLLKDKLKNKTLFSNVSYKKNSHRLIVTNGNKTKCCSFNYPGYTSKEIREAILELMYGED